MARWAVQHEALSLISGRRYASISYFRWRWHARLVAWLDTLDPFGFAASIGFGFVTTTRLLGRVQLKPVTP